MSLKKSFGKLLLLAILQIGLLSGAPIRPDEIEQLMKMSEPCVTQTLRRKETDDDDGEPKPELTSAIDV